MSEMANNMNENLSAEVQAEHEGLIASLDELGRFDAGEAAGDVGERIFALTRGEIGLTHDAAVRVGKGLSFRRQILGNAALAACVGLVVTGAGLLWTVANEAGTASDIEAVSAAVDEWLAVSEWAPLEVEELEDIELRILALDAGEGDLLTVNDTL